MSRIMILIRIYSNHKPTDLNWFCSVRKVLPVIITTKECVTVTNELEMT
jgi:hypothetical protein